MSGKKNKKEGEFECEHCSKSFTDSRYLRKHIGRMHDNTKKREPVGKLTCGVCKKHFPRLSHLTRHQVVHFNVRDWSCPFCSLSFMQKAHLITHMGRKHRNERVADIEEEMEKVRGREDEIIHGPAPDPSLPSTSHSSPRLITDQLHIPIIICAFCGANFMTNSELKRHKETHHVVQRCLRCGVNVNGRDEMREHKRKKHTSLSFSSPSSSSFTCIHCSLQFTQRTQFDRHFISRHFAISRCEYCREELRTPIERRDHMRDEHEELRCGYCNELMNNEDVLIKHVYATHWNRTERIKTKKKKSRKSEKVIIEEKEEEEERAEIGDIGEVDEEKEKDEDNEDEERQINISILLKLPLKENADNERDLEGWTNIPMGKNLPSDITNLYPQLKTLHVVVPSSLTFSHSLLVALPLPFDESINEWTERTIEIDLTNTVFDEVPVDN